ncbi:MAG: SWF/SNF helicase family protein, partial [Magnetococcales bacterium]|nr:SWF/SNF helicase family protein [Magnetococcales bacterium]
EDSVIDAEDIDEEEIWAPDPKLLASLLTEGVALLNTSAAQAKWNALCKIVDAANGEKIVFFAQPVETVGVVAAFLEKKYGNKPALIMGNQSDEDRLEQVRLFQTDTGPRFLVSSRAGGEGLNMQRAHHLVHLDVPWNPMEMEQRVGRVHRFGSKKTIVVDTVVVEGSREVDMYRIARDKLRLIATQLDPEQFEQLFSRVMSLVPPKELEEIIGGAAPGPFGNSESNEIGRLVTEGFRSWNQFDETYRHEAERIRNLEAGQAMWEDIGHFLIKYAGAESADDVSLARFEFRDHEIHSINENLTALKFKGKTYVCGNTDGLLAETSDGGRAYALGLNLEEICLELKNAFLPNRETGIIVVRRSKELDSLIQDVSRIEFLLRQSIRSEGGVANEANLSLHAFALTKNGAGHEISPTVRSQMIRSLSQAQRVRDLPTSRDDDISKITIFSNELRQPNEMDRTNGTRHAVWPIATVLFV